jgi:hypothetical protein
MQNLVSGDLLGVCEDVCARAVPACGVRKCGVGARLESGQRHGCGETVPGTAGGRRTLVGSPCMRGRLGWCGVQWFFQRESVLFIGTQFSILYTSMYRSVMPVAVWGMALLLSGGRVLYGRVPNNAYSQGSQELGASAGAC